VFFMKDDTTISDGVTTPISLFSSGLTGSVAYRIPSMITTLKGTIIAGIDARIANSRDNPNKIDTSIRRSTDNGETWGEVQKLVAYPGEGLEGSAAIDTALLQDEETGTIWMFFSHTPGGIGLWSSEEGTGFDDNGNRLLFDSSNNQYTLNDGGAVYDQEGKITEFTVDGRGNVFQNGEQRGNIYLKKGADPNESLLEARTSFLQVIKSEDDGLTWSKPIELNPQVKESWMKFIGTGPGRGLQLKNGSHRGRLVVPVYFSNRNGKMSCAVIYSDDHGKSWQRGNSPNEGRVFNGNVISAETLSEDGSDLTESQVIEMPNGDVRIYMRNHSGRKRTASAISKDGGEAWTDLKYDETLIDSTCQSTVITYPDLGDGKTRILFANPADPKERKKGTVRLSEDGGLTWKYSKTIEEGTYSYSCLTILENGEIALLYETDLSPNDWNKIKIKFVKFTLDWIKS
jgi:sialidase-1